MTISDAAQMSTSCPTSGSPVDASTPFDILQQQKIEIQQHLADLNARSQNHFDRVFAERVCYQTQGLQSQDPSNSTLMLSADFKKGIMFPYFRLEAQQIYFLQRPVCNVFGIVEESCYPNHCMLYFYGNDVKGTTWINIVVMLERYITGRMKECKLLNFLSVQTLQPHLT